MKTNFKDSLKHVLVHEGGWADHPKDPGGATMKGVTLAVFRRHYGEDKTKDDLRNISDADLENIYRSGYWDKCSGHSAGNINAIRCLIAANSDTLAP